MGFDPAATFTACGKRTSIVGLRSTPRNENKPDRERLGPVAEIVEKAVMDLTGREDSLQAFDRIHIGRARYGSRLTGTARWTFHRRGQHRPRPFFAALFTADQARSTGSRITKMSLILWFMRLDAPQDLLVQGGIGRRDLAGDQALSPGRREKVSHTTRRCAHGANS